MTLAQSVAHFVAANQEVRRLHTLMTEAENAEDWPAALALQADMGVAILQANLAQMRMYQIANASTIDEILKTVENECTATAQAAPPKHDRTDSHGRKNRTGRKDEHPQRAAKGGYQRHVIPTVHGVPAQVPNGHLPSAVHYYAGGTQTWN
jgi:hypothetical protein